MYNSVIGFYLDFAPAVLSKVTLESLEHRDVFQSPFDVFFSAP